MATRKRIGVMVPSTNTTCEADFQMVVPRGFTVHGQRLWLTNDALGEDGMVRMNAEIESGARYLATARVDAIAYGCTTGSFFKGPGWDREMIALIERTAEVPAVATSPAVVDALRFFGARRLSVATPYPEWNNQRLRAYLTAQGFEVLNLEAEPTASRAGNQGINDQDPRRRRRLRLARLPARRRRAPVLVHGVAVGGGGGGDRAEDGQARRHIQPGEHLDDAAPPGPHGTDRRLRPPVAEAAMSEQRVSRKPGGKAASPYGYPWADWLAREDPQYFAARQPVSALSVGEGKELSIKHREMVIIGILAFRGRDDGVVAHMRRAVEHGATKRELLEAIQAAAVPGGGPTLSAGVKGLMQLEAEGAFDPGGRRGR